MSLDAVTFFSRQARSRSAVATRQSPSVDFWRRAGAAARATRQTWAGFTKLIPRRGFRPHLTRSPHTLKRTHMINALSNNECARALPMAARFLERDGVVVVCAAAAASLSESARPAPLWRGSPLASVSMVFPRHYLAPTRRCCRAFGGVVRSGDARHFCEQARSVAAPARSR